MASDPTAERCGGGRATDFTLIAVGVALVLVPYLGRLKHPSLYTDDVVRIAQLQTTTLPRLLFLPFNEHMAPLFQGLSWLTWHLASGSLVRAPMAFTMVSYLPFALSLGLLGWLIRAETRSVPTALAGLAIFGFSWLASETVYWYSASSFMWALAFTIGGWLAATSAASGRMLRGGLGMALASAMAPAWSAIGLLAGPLASLRIVAGEFRGGRRRRVVAMVAPIAGTLAYLSVCWAFRYGDVLADSIGRNVHLRAGLIATARAPIDDLLPGLLGLRPIGQRFGPNLSLGLSFLGILGALLWARRSRQRALILGGLFLILGGYGITFCARGDGGGESVLVAQRYHLFPQLGLALMLAPAVMVGLRRLATQSRTGLLVVGALAAFLALAHAPMLKARGRYYRHPDQARTLAALDRLALICGDLRIARTQALAVLDPIQPRWSPPNSNALEMLAGSETPAKYTNPQARVLLLAALTPGEREALCGGMDASPYLRPIASRDDQGPASSGHLKGTYRVTAVGAGRWLTTGWPSFLEFDLPAIGESSDPPTPIRAIGLPIDMPGASVEVWWRGDHDRWSETRSVHCRLEPSQTGRGWALPTDRLPHWRPARSRHLRLFFRTPGIVAVGAPRLLR